MNPSPTFDVALSSEATLWEAEVTAWHALACGPCGRADWGLGFRYVVLFDTARATDVADFSNTGSGVIGPRTSEETLIAHRFFLGVRIDL